MTNGKPSKTVVGLFERDDRKEVFRRYADDCGAERGRPRDPLKALCSARLRGSPATPTTANELSLAAARHTAPWLRRGFGVGKFHTQDVGQVQIFSVQVETSFRMRKI